jgi:maleate cis-trans isomerase
MEMRVLVFWVCWKDCAVDDLKTLFIESLYADQIDAAVYRQQFAVLADDEALRAQCVATLEAEPVVDGFSRLALMLYSGGRISDALGFWARDFEAGRISWWQATQYLGGVFEFSGTDAAWALAEKLRRALPDGMNIFGTLGLRLGENPRGLELMERDYCDGRLTPGFAINYACALAKLDRISDAALVVADAYERNAGLRDGYARVARSVSGVSEIDVIQLYSKDVELGRISEGAFVELIDQLLHTKGLRTAVEQTERVTGFGRGWFNLSEYAVNRDCLYLAKRFLQEGIRRGAEPSEYQKKILEVAEDMLKVREGREYHFCTVITPDYLCYARALHGSLLRFHSNAVLHVLVCRNGAINRCLDFTDDSLRFYDADELCREGVGRDIQEKYQGDYEDGFRWSLKPVFLSCLLEKECCETVLFVDCDIHFYSDYLFLFDELDDCAVLLTPHWKPYSEPGKDRTFIYQEHFYNGVFNAGFVGVSKAALPHLRWWANACLFHCYIDVYNGCFVDQTHLTVMQVCFEGVKILRHRGCNVSHWNEVESVRVPQADGSVKILDEHPIVFCHFALPSPDRMFAGHDQQLLSFFWSYVFALKEFGMTRLKTLFKQFDHQVGALIDLLGRFEINAVCADTIGAKTAQALTAAGIAIDDSSDVVVFECQTGQGLASEEMLRERFTPEKIYILEHAAPQVKVLSASERLGYALKTLSARGVQRVLIYGAGRHTPKMLSEPIDASGVELVAIVDDDPSKSGKVLSGLRIYSVADAMTLHVDAVVVSSDTIEDLLLEQAQDRFAGLPICALYKGGL